MELRDNRILLSPSDLSDYLACEHLTQLRLAGVEAPESADPWAELIKRKGDEHEARYLAEMEAEGRAVTRIPFEFDWDGAVKATEKAIDAGADVVYQACLVDGDWRGFADFLERQENGGYEVVDTKLARSAQPEHLFQLCFYCSVVARLQGHPAERMHLVLGTGERVTFRVADYDAYYRRTRERFLTAVAGRPDTYPHPVEHCGVCTFKTRCEAQWQADDHLTLVANIRRAQVARLEDAGITRLDQLAEAADVPEGCEGVRAQARLQLYYRRNGSHTHELLPVEDGRGFGVLPEPDEGDVYFDIEGDPFFDADGSLEYLHGVAYRESGDLRYRAFWAHDRDEEATAFEQLVDFLVERRARFPTMHVYHYAHYERSALQRLMQLHGTREDELDDLFRGEVFVDLYQVVRQALRLSLPSYSLKRVEELYFPERETDVLGGEDSTVQFELWLEAGDQTLLDGIEAYNADDCRSTEGLHRWLLELRPPDIAWRSPPEIHEASQETEAAKTEREKLANRLLDGAEAGGSRWLAAQLLFYHQRDAKPAWWEYFRRLRMDEQELIEDADSIGGLEQLPIEPWPHTRSLVHTLGFPPQEFKPNDEWIDPATEKSPGTVLLIDEADGELWLKRAMWRDDPLPRALVPSGPIRDVVLRQAVERVVTALASGQEEYAAAQEVLLRASPQRHLFVQGPPGSGKTWLGAEMAVDAIAAGKRVGVAAQSHKAIHKFLDFVVEWAEKKNVSFRGLKKSSGYAGTRYEGSDLIANSDENADFEGDGHQLIAGTAWLFAREGIEVETLFVDEAGQVSLADALAMATAATDVVMLGDPNQLPQVTQGAQPRSVRASVLEHLLGEAETVPLDRGRFLEKTWRLRPEICGFISQAFYEDRLEPAELCARRAVSHGAGLRFRELPHTGNRQSSLEEADWIAGEVEDLVQGTFQDTDGSVRQLAYEDVLVVAPYNAQVRCLRTRLPQGVAVGTVDKFQGQEAPVVLFSMASSSGEDMPRGVEFLFSRNRFNVAVSRAQCLAYVVASPRLLEARCRSPEQMRLVNAVCRFVELAERT